METLLKRNFKWKIVIGTGINKKTFLIIAQNGLVINVIGETNLRYSPKVGTYSNLLLSELIGWNLYSVFRFLFSYEKIGITFFLLFDKMYKRKKNLINVKLNKEMIKEECFKVLKPN